HRLMVVLLPVVLIGLVLCQVSGFQRTHLREAVLLHLLGLFVAAMVCHGELARDRPPARRLTEYFLWIALGGMLGGAFNSLVAPQVFNRVVEYPLLIVLVCLLGPRLGLQATGAGKHWLDTCVSRGLIVIGLCLIPVFLLTTAA